MYQYIHMCVISNPEGIHFGCKHCKSLHGWAKAIVGYFYADGSDPFLYGVEKPDILYCCGERKANFEGFNSIEEANNRMLELHSEVVVAEELPFPSRIMFPTNDVGVLRNCGIDVSWP